jgi:restriction endonuclease S subunit
VTIATHSQQGWPEVPLGQLLSAIETGKNLRCEERPPEPHEKGVVKVSSVTWGTFDRTQSKTLPSSYEPPPRSLIRGGDFLISRANTLELVGACVLVEDVPDNLYLSDKVLRLVLPDDLKLWLLRFLRSSIGRARIEAASTGNQHSMRNISQEAIRGLMVPLPSDADRRRIVARIDSLSTKSRRACDHLDHIHRLVEKYKQAILAAAFRGKLLGLTVGPTELLHPSCWDLPAGWRWVHFSEAAEIASNLVKPQNIPELPHIAPDNVEGGTGRLLPYRTIQEDKVISPKHRFKPGQVIYSKIRPYLRKAVLVDFEGACSADMYPLSPHEGVDNRFLLYWLISEQLASFTVEHEGRTVLPKINQEGLNQTPFPMAPVVQQGATARRIETAFAWIDRLSAEARSARRLIDHLDQAVLAKAFRGELVPQDPADEPAPTLLARIRAEREATARPRGAGRRSWERSSAWERRREGGAASCCGSSSRSLGSRRRACQRRRPLSSWPTRFSSRSTRRVTIAPAAVASRRSSASVRSTA